MGSLRKARGEKDARDSGELGYCLKRCLSPEIKNANSIVEMIV